MSIGLGLAALVTALAGLVLLQTGLGHRALAVFGGRPSKLAALAGGRVSSKPACGFGGQKMSLGDKLSAAGMTEVSQAAFAASSAATALIVGATVALVFHNPAITLVGVVSGASLPRAWLNRRVEQARETLAEELPDALDDIRAGLHADLSIEQATALLEQSSAEELQPLFVKFARHYRRTGDFAGALYDEIQRPLASSEADRVVETLVIAQEIGDARLAADRLLQAAEALRQVRQARKELRGQLGFLRWVARLGAATPWVCLLAFSGGKVSLVASGAGKWVVGLGAIWTIGTYALLVRRFVKLPPPRRIWGYEVHAREMAVRVAKTTEPARARGRNAWL